MIKLDLGGGEAPMGNGYLNVDAQAMPGVDVQADLLHLPFRDASADAVLLSQVIEHFVPGDAQILLDEAMRVLKPGGKLNVAFPDLLKIARHSRQLPFAIIELHTFGLRTNPYQYHKSGWCTASMRTELIRRGFKNVREVAESVWHQYAELTTELEGTKC